MQRWICTAALLVACARPRPASTPPVPSYHCQGRVGVAPPPHVPPLVPPDAVGRLLVERLPARAPSPPAAQTETETEAGAQGGRYGDAMPFAHVRLRVVAEAVPLSRFATALAEAVNVSVVVTREALNLRVTVSGPDMSADVLVSALAANGISHHYSAEAATLTFATEDEIADRYSARHGCVFVEPPETRLITLPPGQPYAEVAQYFCERIATSRGTADVVAGRLIVRDEAPYLNQLELLVDTLAGHPPPPRRPPGRLREASR